MSKARLTFLSIMVGAFTASPAIMADPETPQVSGALRYFDGKWHCDGVFPSNGRKISANLTFVWYVQTGSVLKQHDDQPPNAYHAVELWAVQSAGSFNNMMADAFGGVRFFTSSGWTKDVLTWAGNSDQTRQEQFIYTRLNSDTMRMDWTVSKNGAAFVLGDTLTCSRGKVAAPR